MTFLESTIMKLTRETPSGGTYQIGDASITVSYSSDLWEWEYGGKTYWDVLDLAKAIIQGSKAFPINPPSLPSKAWAIRGARKDNSSPGRFFMELPEAPWGHAL